MVRYVFFCIHNLLARIGSIFLLFFWNFIMQRFKISSLLSEQGDEFSNFLKIKGLGIYFISVTEPICNLCGM